MTTPDRTGEAALLPAERMAQVRSLVEDRQRVTVAEIVDELGVSPATARRALGTLAERGEVQRVRGGALAVRSSPPELPVLLRTGTLAEEKARIGTKAASLVADGETVFISSGTTALEVARHLRLRRGLTVVTNNLLALDLLRDTPDLEVVVLGGLLRRSEQSLIGHVTEGSLREVRAAKVFFGIRAIHPKQGLTNDFLPETQTDRALLRLGGEVIVVADHSKCGFASTSWVGPVSAMDVLVTDTGTPDDFVAAIEAEGVRVWRV